MFCSKSATKKTDTCRTTNSLLKVKENEEKEEKGRNTKGKFILESNSNSSVRHISDTACSKPQSVTKPATDPAFYNSLYSLVLASVMNPNTSPVMNFSQHIPYGFNQYSPAVSSASTLMAGTPGNVTPP